MQTLNFVPRVPKNDAIFDSYKDAFLAAEKSMGAEKAYRRMHQLFSEKLKPAYDAMSFTRGNPHDFARCVGERDKSVGLRVRLIISSDEKEIKYEFLTDPFSNLKGQVDPQKFYGAFMDFKVDYLLGPDWTYRMTKHHHRGDRTTEFLITKKEEIRAPKIDSPDEVLVHA